MDQTTNGIINDFLCDLIGICINKELGINFQGLSSNRIT